MALAEACESGLPHLGDAHAQHRAYQASGLLMVGARHSGCQPATVARHGSSFSMQPKRENVLVARAINEKPAAYDSDVVKARK